MHRPHPALFCVQTVSGTAPSPCPHLSSSRATRTRFGIGGLSLVGLMLVCSGCYGPYQSPYGGYGSPYGYPPAGVPTQTLQPGGTYTPSPYGQPMPPNGTFPPTIPGQPSTISPTGGNTPYYNSGSVSPPYDGGGVPTYSDPNEVQFKQPVQPDNTAVGEYGAIEGASAATAGVAKVDLDTAHFVVDESNFDLTARPEAAAALPTTELTEAAPVVADAFQPPLQTEAAVQFNVADTEAAPAPQVEMAEANTTAEALPAPSPLPFAAEATPLPSAASTPVPASVYAHDVEFGWLRGVLRFDAASGVWTIVYSDTPSVDDEHGGKLLVADSPLLEQFKPQAVVLLRGEIDAQQSASAGRAVFRADVIEPVELSVP